MRKPGPFRFIFPPQPPPLGQAISRNSYSVPSDDTWYVNEIFYPALRTRFAAGEMNPRPLNRLEQYHAAKRALQNELRSELDRLHDSPPAERAQALTALGRRQTPQIAQLEAAAETLRQDLTKSDQWGALREWRLGDKDKRGYSPHEVGKVMLAAAYFESGLSLSQRGLLREIYLELHSAADSEANAAAAQPFLFFSPAPARMLLPNNLDARLSAKLADYQSRKSVLKKELYDTVHANDRMKLGVIRTNAFKALAQAQAARIFELDKLAEEIRPGLVDFVESAALGGNLFSPALQARIGRMVGETKDYYRNYRVAVFQPGLSPEQRRLFFDGVIEELRLPLPPGEPQPTRRMPR